MENQDKSYQGNPQIPQLLSALDVAAILNVSRSYTYILMQSGDIPTVRLGKACRVRQQDLEDYIEKNIHSREKNP